tara:strand:- start:696 stop:1259 length:564 start_codon:yes stop_codon:yes gene_type:complete
MARIVKIKVEPMTEETFAPFGEMMEAKDKPSEERKFFPVNFEADVSTTVNVIWQPYEGLSFSQMERHFGVTQAFVQLEGSPAVVCAAKPTDFDDPYAIPKPEDIHAFLIDPAKGFSFGRGTWHSLNRFILSPPGSTFLILNSNPNPSQIVEYDEGYGLVYKDLGTDPSPKRVEYDGDVVGVTFELAL